MIDFSQKQKEVWHNTIENKHRWNVSYGATGSGKTYLDYYRIPKRIRQAEQEGLVVFLGNTKGTLERNILDPLRQIWTPALVGNIGSNNKVSLFGRECYALGADKVNQVSKIQGATIAYCYGDEVTTWADIVFTMLKSRLRLPGSCFDGTCNPDRPNHWFKTFLDSDADIYKMGFNIDDNPFLPPGFADTLKKEYSGTVFFDRFILGKWVAAEGAVYPMFANNQKRYCIDEIPKDVIFCNIGVDFGGNKSATTFQCTGFRQGLKGIVTIDEYYQQGITSPEKQQQAFVDFVRKQSGNGLKIMEIYCDSAEQTLIEGFKGALLKNKIGVPIKNAIKGEIIDRVRFYCLLLATDRYQIMSHCKHTFEAFANAVFDDKSMDDKRLDDGTTNVDTLDAQEYSTEKYQKQMIDMMMLSK